MNDAEELELLAQLLAKHRSQVAFVSAGCVFETEKAISCRENKNQQAGVLVTLKLLKAARTRPESDD